MLIRRKEDAMTTLVERMVADGFDADIARAIVVGMFEALATPEQLARFEEHFAAGTWDFMKKS
jgi:ABC-type transporter MlaC component